MRSHLAPTLRRVLTLLVGLGVILASARSLEAQIDPRQMAGIPRPDSAQPPQSVSVRLIRGEMTNSIANHPVDLIVDGTTQTVSTNQEGRAQFYNLRSGASVKAVTTVDGERLESQEFQMPAPGQPGIRLLLVATDKSKPAESALSVPAVPGEVTIGGQSRIVIEPDDDVVRVFYLLDIVNAASTPVEPASLFMFDTPNEAQSTTIMEGSPAQATANGTRVRVQGPFAPGETFVQVGYVLPAPSGRVELAQTFPARLEQLAVMVKKVGEARLSSPAIDRQQEMPAGGETYIVAVGDRAVAAGNPIGLTITGLPHHSAAPRWVALGIAVTVTLIATVLAWTPVDPQTRASERKQLVARREKLFQELLRLETENRRGKTDPTRYASRREALLAELEQVYGALDSDDTGPEPASRAGLAA
jgi:hypothetical protein